MSYLRSVLAFAAAAIVPAAMAHAGVVFEVETTYYRGGTTDTEKVTMAAEGNNLTADIAGKEGSDDPDRIIFRGDRREMIAVNHGDKTFIVMDEAQIKAMRSMMGDGATGAEMGGAPEGMEAMIQDALKNVPEDQRAMVEKMMRDQLQAQAPSAATGAAKPADIEYRNTGEEADQEGYPSVKYVALRNGQVFRELWITNWDEIDGGDEARTAFRAVAEFWNESFGDLPQMNEDNPFEVFEKADGIPVLTRDFSNGEIESESVLRSVTERDLDPAAFEPPPGYARQQMGM